MCVCVCMYLCDEQHIERRINVSTWTKFKNSIYPFIEQIISHVLNVKYILKISIAISIQKNFFFMTFKLQKNY